MFLAVGYRFYALVSKDSEPVKPKKNDAADGEHDQAYAVKSVAKETSNLPPLDAESEKRILAFMKDATSSITLAQIKEKHKVPTTHAYSSENSVEKSITLGKVEGSVETLCGPVDHPSKMPK